jgi:hypothetical protein
MADANLLMAWFEVLTIAVIVAGLVYLVVLSAVVHDTKFVLQHPLMFVFEVAIMFAIPGLPVLLFIITQGAPLAPTIKLYIGIGVKFAIFHVLFHLSGLYRRLLLIDYPFKTKE